MMRLVLFLVSGALLFAAPALAKNKFVLNDSVRTVAGTAARSFPSLSKKAIRCTKPTGALGIIAGGPAVMSGYVWWNVQYKVGCSGWTIQSYLVSYIPLPPAVPSVLDYGAIPGTCADTAAISANNRSIQAALDSGKPVYFPPGNYPHSVLGFKITTPGQHIHGGSCAGTGTSAPMCPSAIQDCSSLADYIPNVCPLGDCGYLSVHANNVEIDNLKIRGNTGGAWLPSISHKGIYATDPAAALYVHDLFVTETAGEAIYSDGAGSSTRYIRNTVTGGAMQGLNTNNYTMENVQITDNYVADMTGGCILVAAHDAYVLRNTCRGGVLGGGADAINVTTASFQVTAYNAIDSWNAACCAVGIMRIGFPNGGPGFENFNGAGVIAYNTVTNSLFTHIPGAGAALMIDNTVGPMVVAHNTITYNGDRGQPLNPGLLIKSPSVGPILISNNIFDGTENDETVGIQINDDVSSANQVQINVSNTFGTIPTPTQYLVAPGGAPLSVFQPTIQKALPYLPNGLSVN